MKDSDTSPGFNYCFPDMAMKTELRIENHTKVFMLLFNSNFGAIEKHGWMGNCNFHLGKDNLYDLFAFVRIELHLLMVDQIIKDIRIYI